MLTKCHMLISISHHTHSFQSALCFPKTADMEGRFFVVAVDGINSAPVDLALKLAGPNDKGVFLFVEPETPQGFLADPFHDQIARVEEYQTQKKAKTLREAFDSLHDNFEFVELASSDIVGKAVCDYANEKNATMVVMGKSSSLIDELLLGSNSIWAVRNSLVPVLVARK